MNNRTPVIAAGLGHAVKAALAMVAGCAFTPTGAVPGDGAVTDGDDVPTDVRVDAIDGTTGAPFCDPGDTSLILCLSFDDGTSHNQAIGNLQPERSSNVAPVTGRVGQGGGFGATTVLHFDEAASLELVQPYAFELFVKLDAPPATTGNMRIGILDNDSQYSLFARVRDIGSGPQIYAYCNAQATVFSDAPLEVGMWHHIACVQDADRLTIYVDGVMSQIGNATPTSTFGGRGTTIGQDCDNNVGQVDDALIGAVDEVRLWRAARTSAQIQAAAARR